MCFWRVGSIIIWTPGCLSNLTSTALKASSRATNTCYNFFSLAEQSYDKILMCKIGDVLHPAVTAT